MPSPAVSNIVAVRTGSSQDTVSNLAFEPKTASQKSSCVVMAEAITTLSLLVKITVILRLVSIGIFDFKIWPNNVHFSDRMSLKGSLGEML